MSSIPKIFDRKKIAEKQARVAENFQLYDFLYIEVCDRLLDRLNDLSRRFENILVIGAGHGRLKARLEKDFGYDASDITVVDMFDVKNADVIADEEVLPFPGQSFDCIISCLSLPFVNDVPGVLAQSIYSLKPDGLFLAASLGTMTLNELRDSLMRAELDVSNGVANRVAPFVDIVDATGLMQRAKFALPVVDQDIITVSYPDIYKLMKDLQGMGVSDPLYRDGETLRLSKSLFARADEVYRQAYPDGGGRIKASFEILYLTGWRPDASQQQPLRPGTAKNRLSDALKTDETPLNDIASP